MSFRKVKAGFEELADILVSCRIPRQRVAEILKEPEFQATREVVALLNEWRRDTARAARKEGKTVRAIQYRVQKLNEDKMRKKLVDSFA
jgi:hypothetical protein